MSDTLNVLTNIGTGITVGGAVVPPADEQTQLIHIILGVITGISQLVLLFKNRRKTKSA